MIKTLLTSIIAALSDIAAQLLKMLKEKLVLFVTKPGKQCHRVPVTTFQFHLVQQPFQSL